MALPGSAQKQPCQRERELQQHPEPSGSTWHGRSWEREARRCKAGCTLSAAVCLGEKGRGGNEPRVLTSRLASPGPCKAYSSSCSRGCPVGTGEMPLPGINGHPRSASPPDLDVGAISEVLLCCSLPHLTPPYPIVKVRGGRRGDGVSSARWVGWFTATSQ